MSIAHLSIFFKQSSVQLNAVNLSKHSIWTVFVCFTLVGCGDPSPAAAPLLKDCTPVSITEQLSLGIGKDEFTAIESIEHALIVGGYQGGHHLWGAVRFQDIGMLERVRRLHLILCDEDQIIAQALYGSVGALLRSDSSLYGIPIVFLSGVDVASLDGHNMTLLAGIETENSPVFSHGEAELKCCGHVADGD